MEELKKIPLAEFCIEKLGYLPNKGHDSKNWRSLTSPSGQKIITKSEPNTQGHYLFRCETEGVGGTIIDLLLHLEGYSFSDIKNNFPTTDYTAPPSQVREKKEDHDNTMEVKKALKQVKKVFHPNYLTQRGVSQKTIKYFNLSVGLNDFVLPLYRRRSGKWMAQTSIRYYFDRQGERRKLFQAGLEKKGAYCILKAADKTINDFETAAMFESPIDAMSFAQIFNYPNVLYMATCGTLTHDFQSTVGLDLEVLGIKNLTLCFDNDEAGEKMSSTLTTLLQEKISCRRQKPIKKDWNEYLMNF